MALASHFSMLLHPSFGYFSDLGVEDASIVKGLGLLLLLWPPSQRTVTLQQQQAQLSMRNRGKRTSFLPQTTKPSRVLDDASFPVLFSFATRSVGWKLQMMMTTMRPVVLPQGVVTARPTRMSSRRMFGTETRNKSQLAFLIHI